MSVSARKPYVGVPRDGVEHYHGKQIVYVSWDQHLLFAAAFLICVPRTIRFGDFVDGPLTQLLQPDPDAAAIDWSRVAWLKGDQPWTPDFAKTLVENGIGHKEQLRFRTPGLNSLLPAA